MGFKHRVYLHGTKIYECAACRTHLATIESMISRRFNGQHGQAYLFDAVFNVVEDVEEDRMMSTGRHRVRDIRCCKCSQLVGWKYEIAYEQAQKYKEGKSILEKALLLESTPTATPIPMPSSSSSSNGHSPASSASPNDPHPAQLINVNILNTAHFSPLGSSGARRGEDESSPGRRSSASARSMSVESDYL